MNRFVGQNGCAEKAITRNKPRNEPGKTANFTAYPIAKQRGL